MLEVKGKKMPPQKDGIYETTLNIDYGLTILELRMCLLNFPNLQSVFLACLAEADKRGQVLKSKRDYPYWDSLFMKLDI